MRNEETHENLKLNLIIITIITLRIIFRDIFVDHNKNSANIFLQSGVAARANDLKIISCDEELCKKKNIIKKKFHKDVKQIKFFFFYLSLFLSRDDFVV